MDGWISVPYEFMKRKQRGRLISSSQQINSCKNNFQDRQRGMVGWLKKCIYR